MQRTLIRLILFLLFPLLPGACGDRYSPWETNVPLRYRDLTAEQLGALNALPPQSLPFTIGLLADPQGTPKDLEKVVDELNKRDDIKFLLVAGDLTDYGLLHEYIWAAEALKRSKVPFLTVVGNHDAIAHGKQIYSSMFGPYDYIFNYGGLKFVMFNSNQYEFGTTDFSWLQSVEDNHTVVVSHVPPVVDMHTLAQVDEWKGINEKAGIIASLHGHRGTEDDDFFMVNGIPYYIAPKLSGRRYSLVTFHADRTVTFKLCRNDCGDVP